MRTVSTCARRRSPWSSRCRLRLPRNPPTPTCSRSSPRAPALAGALGWLHVADHATLLAGLMALEHRRAPADGAARALAHLFAAHAAALPATAPHAAAPVPPIDDALATLLGTDRV